jgi:hypothetical protein
MRTTVCPYLLKNDVMQQGLPFGFGFVIGFGFACCMFMLHGYKCTVYWILVLVLVEGWGT